jgi:hypothetical protein
VARVVAFVPDLLFGSNVLGMLSAGGHAPVLVGDAASLERAVADGADALVLDLTVDAPERIELVRRLGPIRTLAFYSHVEADVRALAQDAGFALVVPRSRMAREGAALIERLLEAGIE